MNIIRRFPLASATIAVGLSLASIAPATAGEPRGAPGSFERIMCIKLPAVYCPTPSAPAAASMEEPLPSVERWRRAKYPWLYTTDTALRGPICPAQQMRPGEFRTVMAIKLPAVYGPHDCV